MGGSLRAPEDHNAVPTLVISRRSGPGGGTGPQSTQQGGGRGGTMGGHWSSTGCVLCPLKSRGRRGSKAHPQCSCTEAPRPHWGRSALKSGWKGLLSPWEPPGSTRPPPPWGAKRNARNQLGRGAPREQQLVRTVLPLERWAHQLPSWPLGRGRWRGQGDRPLCPEPGGSQVTGHRGAATGMT